MRTCPRHQTSLFFSFYTIVPHSIKKQYFFINRKIKRVFSENFLSLFLIFLNKHSRAYAKVTKKWELKLPFEHLDVAFDAVGGPHIEQIAKAMSVGGTMVMHGALSPEITPFPLKVALRKSLTMRGFLFLEVLHDPVLREQARRFILSSIGAGYLRPVIDCCFNFEDMHDAQRYLESNQQIGKIVVTLNT